MLILFVVFFAVVLCVFYRQLHFCMSFCWSLSHRICSYSGLSSTFAALSWQQKRCVRVQGFHTVHTYTCPRSSNINPWGCPHTGLRDHVVRHCLSQSWGGTKQTIWFWRVCVTYPLTVCSDQCLGKSYNPTPGKWYWEVLLSSCWFSSLLKNVMPSSSVNSSK